MMNARIKNHMVEAISQPKNRRPASDEGLKFADGVDGGYTNSHGKCASTSWLSQVVIPSKCCEAAQRRKAPKREPAVGF